MSKKPVKIAFPEASNPIIKQAAEYLGLHEICQPVILQNLAESLELLKNCSVDGVVAGIDLSSRDVILKAREIVGLNGIETFSSLFLIDLPDKKYIISDGATCRNPTAKQLADIVILVNQAAIKIFGKQDTKIAMLSFSTAGSGGDKDPSIIKIRQAIDLVKARDESIQIDGEMQLDAAISPAVAHKKMPLSQIAGQANVLICPDINSANILYKSLEQIAGAKAYGPILLGFAKPISDLSRGSSCDDVIGTVQTLIKLI